MIYLDPMIELAWKAYGTTPTGLTKWVSDDVPKKYRTQKSEPGTRKAAPKPTAAPATKTATKTASRAKTGPAKAKPAPKPKQAPVPKPIAKPSVKSHEIIAQVKMIKKLNETNQLRKYHLSQLADSITRVDKDGMAELARLLKINVNPKQQDMAIEIYKRSMQLPEAQKKEVRARLDQARQDRKKDAALNVWKNLSTERIPQAIREAKKSKLTRKIINQIMDDAEYISRSSQEKIAWEYLNVPKPKLANMSKQEFLQRYADFWEKLYQSGQNELQAETAGEKNMVISNRKWHEEDEAGKKDILASEGRLLATKLQGSKNLEHKKRLDGLMSELQSKKPSLFKIRLELTQLKNDIHDQLTKKRDG